MTTKLCCALAIGLLAASCGGRPEPPSASTPEPSAERRDTVFDPLVGTLDRAKGVQDTVAEQAAAQRRQIEQQER